MEEIIFPNQIRMYRRLRGRSMQELADHCPSAFLQSLKLKRVTAAWTRSSWFVLLNFWTARCRIYLLMNRIPSRKSSNPGGANRREETKSTKKRFENFGCRFASDPQRKEPDAD